MYDDIRDLKTNKEEFIRIVSVFLLIDVYILSSAANFLLFHFFLDINLAKVGMLLTILGFAYIVRDDFILVLKRSRMLLAIIGLWSVYLVINSIVGATQIISIKLTLRVFGAWVVALEIGLLLNHRDKNTELAFLSALIFSLLAITAIWYIQWNWSHYLHWFQQRIPNYIADYNRLNGLYLNPNELGYALVVHAMILIWYSFLFTRFLFVIPFTTILAIVGILKTQSRNSILGISVVITAALIVYIVKVFTKESRKKAALIFLGIFLVFLFGKQYLPKVIPSRIVGSYIILRNSIEEISISKIDKEELYKLIHLQQLNNRYPIWKDAYEKWKKRPWLGLGLGSYLHIQNLGPSYTTHNFLYGILVEQGIIGLGFLIFFTIFLINKMRSFSATCLLFTFPLTLLFDDLSPSYIFPVYTSLVIGFCFLKVNLRYDKSLLSGLTVH